MQIKTTNTKVGVTSLVCSFFGTTWLKRTFRFHSYPNTTIYNPLNYSSTLPSLLQFTSAAPACLPEAATKSMWKQQRSDIFFRKLIIIKWEQEFPCVQIKVNKLFRRAFELVFYSLWACEWWVTVPNKDHGSFVIQSFIDNKLLFSGFIKLS